MATTPPRRKKHRNRPVGEDAAKRLRTEQALRLRAVGCTYRNIGVQLNVSEKTAYLDVQEELGRLDAVVKEKAERLRDLEGRRLDHLQFALAPGIDKGDERAVLAAVRIMERRAKLFGLDAPTTVAGPEGGAVPVRIVMVEDKG